MNGKRKIFIVIFSLIVVLAFGFVSGRFLFPGKSENILKANDKKNLTSSNQNISDTRENAITRTVANVSPAIVGINVTEMMEYRDPFGNAFGDDPFFKQFFGNRSFKQEVHGLGSGFIISEDGYIITNNHATLI